MENVSDVLPRLEFFQKRGFDASVELMSCITVIDFWSAQTQNLMN